MQDKQMNELHINHNRSYMFLIGTHTHVAVYALHGDRRKCQYLIPKDHVMVA
jgi:hypothetical protein